MNFYLVPSSPTRELSNQYFNPEVEQTNFKESFETILRLFQSVINLKPGYYLDFSQTPYTEVPLASWWCYVPQYFSTNNQLFSDSINELKKRVLEELSFIDQSENKIAILDRFADEKKALIEVIDNTFHESIAVTEKLGGNLSTPSPISKVLVNDGHPWISNYFELLTTVKIALTPEVSLPSSSSESQTLRPISTKSTSSQISELHKKLFSKGTPMYGAAPSTSKGVAVKARNVESDTLIHLTKDRPKGPNKRKPTRRAQVNRKCT